MQEYVYTTILKGQSVNGWKDGWIDGWRKIKQRWDWTNGEHGNEMLMRMEGEEVGGLWW